VAIARQAQPDSVALDANWDRFMAEVRLRNWLDLRPYKASQVHRRIRALMQRAGVARLDDYLRVLDREPGKRGELQRAITVAVSEFFRTPEQFEHLAATVLPELLKQRSRLRIWSAGCSYGAEAYSVALLLDELSPHGEHYVLGSDVDELALARARAANSFSERDLLHVPARFRRVFTSGHDKSRFALRSELSSQVTFERHDILSAPVGSDFDLILCRNVMMYFTDEAKRGLYGTLYGALRPGGYLFVGDAEVLNQLPAVGFNRTAVGFYRK
jgi:chemotaxis protein methyltransferase CheR